MSNKNLHTTDHLDDEHEHCCSGHHHDHEHHEHHHSEHDHCGCGHDHYHDHEQHHSHHHPDLSEFDELYHEHGCGCGHDHNHGPQEYQPLVSSQKIQESQHQLHSDQSSLVNTDLSNFLTEFEKLHNKLFNTFPFHSTIGLIYGSVVTDYDDMEEVLKKYLNISNSRINKEYLEMSLKVFTYLQANYLYDFFFLNDFCANFDKSETCIEKLTASYHFLDGFVFAASLGMSNPRFDADTKSAVFEILRDLNTFQLTTNELAQTLSLEYNNTTDKVEQERILNLNLDYIANHNFSQDQELVLLVARDAIMATKNLHDPKDVLERVDLSPVLALAVGSEE